MNFFFNLILLMNNYLSYTTFKNQYIKIYSTKILLNNDILPENIIIFTHQSRHFICDFTETQYEFNVYNNNNNKRIQIFEDQSLGIYASYASSNVVMYPFCVWKEVITEQIKNKFRQIQFLNTSTNIIIKLEPKNNNIEYELCYYINKSILDNLKNGKNINTNKRFIDSFFYKINKDNKDKNILVYFEKIMENIPLKINLKFNLKKKFLKDSIKLFNYQIENINWMRYIEKNISKNKNYIEYFYKPTYDIILTPEYSFTVYKETILPYKNYNIYNSLKYYGGILCDEMGLGKSLCMLYHLFSNEKKDETLLYNNFIEFNENKCNYFYKRGKFKGTHCIKECFSDLYCKEHNESIFIDKRSTKLKNIEEFNISNYILVNNNNRHKNNNYDDYDDYDDRNEIEGNIYKTNASLIICPNQLCDQWVREYYDKFIIKKRVILIVTSDQFNNLTFADILFADLIVISYNLLLNNCYKCNINNKIQMSTNENILKSRISNLNNFYFNTIVHDEFHEIEKMYKSKDILNRIKILQSKFKWNISGTPFANGVNSFLSAFELISNINVKEEIMIELIDKCQILYRRNTKKYIKNNESFVKNIINEQVKLLSFTNEERTIYDAHNKGDKTYDFLIQLCCHPEVIASDTKELIKNCKSLDEIQQVLLKYNKNKLNTLTNEINTITQEINNSELEFHQYIIYNNINMKTYKIGDNQEIDNFRVELGNSKRNLTNKKKQYDSVKRVYDYFEVSIKNIRNKQIETCPICLDESDISNLCITKCGHTFCWNCINELIEITHNYNNLKCPKCTQPIIKSEIYHVKKENIENIENIENTELNTLIQNIKSTKIGNIIYYINNELKDTDKCIIFSQYDLLLHKIGDILKKYKKNVNYCTGSVYQRKRSIMSFTKNNNDNIIMLSSENAASGINLTVANKIILVEPVYGDAQYRKDIEAQAIGRADRIGQKKEIDVIRFIIKDTIEEKLLNESNVKKTEILEL